MTAELARLQAALPRRYTLVRELDRGGASRVYLARESLPDRDVAIKVLDEALSGKLGPERFVREVQVTSRLSHPYIVPIHAAGDAGGMLYYVMPYIAGRSLRDVLETSGRLPVDDALRVTLQIAGALAHAHQEGIVHRDIKPANILFQSGHAVVADFGISRALHVAEGGDITQTGLSLGTPAYMSPEQAIGDGVIDARTDIYALGCVLYEMLAGHVPFRGRTAQATLAKHVTEVVPPLRGRHDVSEELEQVVLKALAKSPDERFRSAAELAQALRDADARATATVLTPDRVHQTWRGMITGRSVKAAGIVLVVAAVGLAYQAWTSGPEPVTAVVTGTRYLDSVAVTPLENRTGDPALQYLGASIADEISGHLAEVPEVKVMAPYSVQSLWENNLGMARLLDSLNVGHLFGGAIEVRGDSVVINLQHFDIQGRLVDTRSYSGDPSRVDSLQRAAAHSVAEAFLADIGVARTFDAQRPFGPGRDEYLNGAAWLGQRTPEGIRTAIERFSEAIELNPSYAAAYAGLSNAYALSLIYMYDIGVTQYEAAARALSLADRSAELDPSDPTAHTARGYIRGLLREELDSAQVSIDRALAIAPNAADAPSWSARILEARGDAQEAFTEAVRARDLDPFSAGRRLTVSGLALVRGDYALAVDEAREALRLEPTVSLGRAFEGRALALAGRSNECLSLDLGVYLLVRALCLQASGQADAARDLAQSVASSLDRGRRASLEYWDVLPAQDLAVFHAFTGNASEATRWLERAFDLSPFGVDSRLLDSALFDRVREDPDFATALVDARARAWPRVLQERARFEAESRPR